MKFRESARMNMAESFQKYAWIMFHALLATLADVDNAENDLSLRDATAGEMFQQKS